MTLRSTFVNIKAATLVMLSSGSIALAQTNNLRPTGPWKIGVADGQCVGLRLFSNGRETLTLYTDIDTFSTDRTVGFIMPRVIKSSFLGDGIVTGIDNVSVSGRFKSEPSTLEDGQSLKIYINSSDFKKIENEISISFIVNSKKYDFLSPELKVVNQALFACQISQLSEFGLTPSNFIHVAVPAHQIDRETSSISYNDYPVDSIRRSESGSVTMIWKISVEGKPLDCKVIKSSGFKTLDTASCMIRLRGLRYTPAIDHDGKPTSSLDGGKIIWKLPKRRP